MRRREFVALGAGVAAALALAGAPLSIALGQTTDRALRVAYLAPGPNAHVEEAFRRGLADLGWREGANLTIERRYGAGGGASLDAEAAALARTRPDVVVTTGVAATAAAQRATTELPIVFAPTGDPVRAGFVRSLARPGGNLTGVSLYQTEVAEKRIEILRDAVPHARRVAVVGNARSPSASSTLDDAAAAAARLGMRAHPFSTDGAGEIETLFAAMHSDRLDAAIVLSDPDFDRARARIVGAAAAYRIPTIYEHRAFVEAGGLLSYGPDIDALSYRAASYVDRIAKGARPTDLPVEQPTKFELLVNARTARELGLELPPALLARADEVIE